MDFITGLPNINRYNALLVCVDKFGKLCRLILCRAGENELSAPAIAKLFFEHVVRLYGVPRVVLHDRDPRFYHSFLERTVENLRLQNSLFLSFPPAD